MKLPSLLILSFLFIVVSCGTSKSTTSSDKVPANESVQEKNSVTISLINRIRQLRGVIVSNGVPVFNKTSNSVNPGISEEPLYILNGYPVGNSFWDINQLVDNVNVKKIETLTGSDASIYGSRGANGVILITTY